MSGFDPKSILSSVIAGEGLSEGDMAAALGLIMDGDAHDAWIGALLAGLSAKGETVDEVTGAVRAMRARVTPVHPQATRLLDTCGTGGDGAGTFNVSTAVAFVCAGAGVTVAKHGNRAISSKVGSADVLETLGVRLDLTPAQVTECIDEVGIGFLFAPAHHAALRFAGPARRALGVRTILNLLGPMTNPATATHQLIGVFARERVRTMAEVLGRLGTVRALVVHGEDGMDEISPCTSTHAAFLSRGAVQMRALQPEDVGIPRCAPEALAGGDAATNAGIIRAVLAGAPGPCADIVRLNAGAALWIAEAAPTWKEGVELATATLKNGAAVTALHGLINKTQALASAKAAS